MIEEWYVGFYRPYLRTKEGRLTYQGILGHCEIWGFTADGTWLFIDPQGKGSRVHIEHRHDEVRRHLAFRFGLCDLILRLPAEDPEFRLPFFPPITCASLCGHLLGVRALVPTTLRRKLLAKGAEVVHETAGGRSAAEARPTAGASEL